MHLFSALRVASLCRLLAIDLGFDFFSIKLLTFFFSVGLLVSCNLCDVSQMVVFNNAEM